MINTLAELQEALKSHPMIGELFDAILPGFVEYYKNEGTKLFATQDAKETLLTTLVFLASGLPPIEQLGEMMRRVYAIGLYVGITQQATMAIDRETSLKLN